MVVHDLILSSGVSLLDRVLDGGLHTGRFTHVYGEAGSGKTTLALQFVNAACGLGVCITFINSEMSSPLERLKQITGKEFVDIEDLVRIISPKSFIEQGAVIDDLEFYAKHNTKLIVIDTLTKLYRAALEDKSVNYAAHRELNTQAGILKGLARHRDIAVLVLNQVRGSMKKGHDFEPVAGNILAYWSDSVIRLRKGKSKGERIVERLMPEESPRGETLYLAQTGFVTERNLQEGLQELGESTEE